MKIKRNHLIWSIATIIITFLCGEIFARYYLGLGSPPLFIPHQKIEYMYKPNQNVYRFGNHFIINQYGMRTPPFSIKKKNNEYRIMVFGDSILNGGNLTDHADLATNILMKKLNRLDSTNIIIGNISAGSWGPGNWLAYAMEYGFFEAEVIVLVISSHDYVDTPTFHALDENHPTEQPVSALLEGLIRYLPRYITLAGTDNINTTPLDQFVASANELDEKKALSDLKKFLTLAKNNSNRVIVLQHWEKAEIKQGFANAGNKKIRAICKQAGILPVSLEPYFRQSIEKNITPYRDYIHPNLTGQKLIAEAILENISNNSLLKKSNIEN